MTNDSVINTLTKALEENPEDSALRLHLADLLLEKGDLETASTHFEFILKADPANLDALRGAAKIATQQGNTSKAEGYNKLIIALSGTQDTPEPPDNVTPLSGSTNNPKQKDSSEQPQRLKAVDTSDNVSVGPWEEFLPILNE